MEFNIEIRKKQLDNLDQFISSSRDQVESILEYLGWDPQKIAENQKEMIMCRVNPSHRIPVSSAVTHMQNCAWRRELYTDDDKPLSEPKHIPGSSIAMDNMMKVNILNAALAKNPQMRTGWRSHEPPPRTSDRLLSSFTPDERLALYDYSVASTVGPPEVPEFNITKPKHKKKHNMTPEEVRAMERDAKRRRIKYKSKCVHTNKKSATEIMREVIDVQMEEYADWLRPDENISCNEEQETNGLPLGPVSPPSPQSQTSYRSPDSRQLNNHHSSTSRDVTNEEYLRKSIERSIEPSDNHVMNQSDRLSKDREVSLDRSHHHSIEHSRHQSIDRCREHSRHLERPRSPDVTHTSRERSRERSKHWPKNRTPERTRERYKHRSQERSRSRSTHYDHKHDNRHKYNREENHSVRRRYHDRMSDWHRHHSREFSSGSSHSRQRDRFDR